MLQLVWGAARAVQRIYLRVRSERRRKPVKRGGEVLLGKKGIKTKSASEVGKKKVDYFRGKDFKKFLLENETLLKKKCMAALNSALEGKHPLTDKDASRGALMAVHAAAGLAAAGGQRASARLLRAAEGLIRTAIADLGMQPAPPASTDDPMESDEWADELPLLRWRAAGLAGRLGLPTERIPSLGPVELHAMVGHLEQMLAQRGETG
ncbi:unnamed protein product [Prorocentrum cordatum]|uniref:Uncharacterized protein n=1 Tax=Prorocentrum cordatum TaxID=2364126 RepID=A0ABN9SJR9_9DINO|nr:unnamed protein product [Polarella glacialis]